MIRLSLIVLCTLGGIQECTAQASELPDCSAEARTKPSKNVRTISGGVLNGKALSLPKPSYPAAGTAVNAHGAVTVSVTIDERGCVTDAEAKSGNPLLIAGSVAAARASVFAPVLLSGEPVRVTGVIVYNYISDRMNWLELGYESDNISLLIDALPAGHENVRRKLKSARTAPWDQRAEVLASALDDLKDQIKSDTKSAWLFRLGQLLADFKNGSRLPEGEPARALKEHLANMPPTTSYRVYSEVTELLNSKDPELADKRLTAIIQRLFALGN
jgi:hypothetical protein